MSDEDYDRQLDLDILWVMASRDHTLADAIRARFCGRGRGRRRDQGERVLQEMRDFAARHGLKALRALSFKEMEHLFRASKAVLAEARQDVIQERKDFR
jgi:hypothetical protein